MKEGYWYCTKCKIEVEPRHVTFWETHDERFGGCGCRLSNGKPAESGNGVPADAACFFKDGTSWCCVRGDFINLQESPAGFGDTMDEALNHLHAQCATPNAEITGG